MKDLFKIPKKKRKQGYLKRSCGKFNKLIKDLQNDQDVLKYRMHRTNENQESNESEERVVGSIRLIKYVIMETTYSDGTTHFQFIEEPEIVKDVELND